MVWTSPFFCLAIFINALVSNNAVSVPPGETHGVENTLSEIGRTELIKLFTVKDDKEGGKTKPRIFPIRSSEFDGAVQAVDPEEHIKVEVESFNLEGDCLRIKLTVGALFDLAGTLKKTDLARQHTESGGIR